jgi:plastocyanin
MRGPELLLTALATTAVAAGCGSSSTQPATTGAPAPASTGTAPVLKVTGTPKYVAPSKGSPVLSGSASVAYRNISIAPDTLRVRVGTVITWRNYDPVTHDVTSESGPQHFASGGLGEGATFRIVAARPGLIHYMCTLHPASMNGTIEVVR